MRAKGYLTLDIRRYADLGLSLVLPVFFLLLGGIPLPGGAVWIDHGAIRSRAVRSLVSLAGPAANLVIGALLTMAVAFVPMPDGLAFGLSALALIQVLAFVLNILPVPGLDGFGVLEPFLPYSGAAGGRAGPAVGADRAVRADPRGAGGGVGAVLGVGALVFSGIGGDAGPGVHRLQRAVLLEAPADHRGERRARRSAGRPPATSAGRPTRR